MTARPMTTSSNGQSRHAWRAESDGMSCAWIARATAPAVMRATPQKMRPRLICIGREAPAREYTIPPATGIATVPITTWDTERAGCIDDTA